MIKKQKNHLESIDYWYDLMIRRDLNKKSFNKYKNLMFSALHKERPNLLSLVLERSCIYQCRHCLFQSESSSEKISQQNNLERIVLNIVKQIPSINDAPHYDNPYLIHEGRILKPWHVGLMKKIKNIRPDIKIGLIDNGSCLDHLDEFKKNDFLLDWLDVSIDGVRETHNKQRNNPNAFDLAIGALEQSREFIVSRNQGGRVTSLLTTTNLNYKDIFNVADMLFSKNLIDEFYITTVSPVREEIANLEVSADYKEGNVNEFKEMWNQIKMTCKKYNSANKQRVFIRFYQHQDIEKLAMVVGNKRLYQSLTDTDKIRVNTGNISFVIDGVKILYLPLSIGTSETFIIDADGKYRLAYCLKYTLEELNSGKSKNNLDTKKYTVMQLTEKTSQARAYERGVKKWIKNFGNESFNEEYNVFRKIRMVK